ncbi:MAG: glycosyltransferase family 2 protein [Planctomycetes bacterium]|nr:glycosyltransferase family 2 protein [Planctomycetota bacterium]
MSFSPETSTTPRASRALAATEQVELSLVAPVYDERDNLEPLYQRVLEVFGSRVRWELVLVDDGSTDGSTEVMRALAQRDRRVRCVVFAHNCGQTTAMRVGIHSSRGPLIATLDADMRNDPRDLPAMIEKLGSHDAVVGYRLKCNDNFVRRVSSKVANAIRNWFSGDTIRDTGCSLNVFRAHAIREAPLHFEGMHRFMPTLLRYYGFSVIEHGVSHHPRRAGASKYGVLNRAFRDLLAVRWMRSRIRRVTLVTPPEDSERQS